MDVKVHLHPESPRRALQERAGGGLAAQTCRGTFASRLQIEPQPAPPGKPRFVLQDPRRQSACILGAAELKTAMLFAPGRTYGDIQHALVEEHRMRASVEQLRRFELALLRLGVLEGTGSPREGSRASAARRFLRWLPSLAFLRLVQMEPDGLLDRVLPRRVVPARLAALGAAVLLVGWGGLYALANPHGLADSIRGALQGTGWLLLFGIIAVSGVFHEGGHALACKLVGVRVRQMGLELAGFLPSAWTRPERGPWLALPSSHRIVTIVAGCLGSLAFGGAGALLWRFGQPDTYTARVGALMVVAALYGSLPALCPLFAGDSSMLLAECKPRNGRPRLVLPVWIGHWTLLLWLWRTC